MDKTDNNKLQLNLSQRHPNDLETDFRFEVIAAALIERGYAPEQIRVIREGMDRRGISKDVEDVYQQYSAEDLMNYSGIFEIYFKTIPILLILAFIHLNCCIKFMYKKNKNLILTAFLLNSKKTIPLLQKSEARLRLGNKTKRLFKFFKNMILKDKKSHFAIGFFLLSGLNDKNLIRQGPF